MILHIEVILIITLVSIVCSLPGIFLVLQGKAMASDAMSHSILLGMVIAFFCTQTLHSAWLFVGAVISAMISMLLSQWLTHKQRITHDAALGLIFPFFFSVAIALINVYARSIHLDTDAVLLGDVAFTPFNRYTLYTFDIGPKALWHMTITLLLSGSCLYFLRKKLIICSFDQQFATSLGIKTLLIHNILLLLASASIVSAFDAAGAVMVVACVIIPPASAYLLSRHLKTMMLHTFGIAIISSLASYLFAYLFDVSIPGMLVSSQLFIFLLLFFAKKKNLL